MSIETIDRIIADWTRWRDDALTDHDEETFMVCNRNVTFWEAERAREQHLYDQRPRI
jgi:hypothetical protein